LVTGAPAFADALASFDCVLTHAVQVHSHTIVIGEVKQLRLREGDAVPLLYFDGRYENLARKAS
jgi:flavin reductase